MPELSVESWKAALQAALNAIPVLEKKGLIVEAARLRQRAAQFAARIRDLEASNTTSVS